MKTLYTFLPYCIALFLFSSCAAKWTPKKKASFDIGPADYDKNWRLSLDSFHLLTPHVEMSATGKTDLKESIARQKTSDFILAFHKDKFPNTKYYELELMYEDYRTINSYLEYHPYYKYLYPEREVQITDYVVAPDKKYGLLIQVISRYGAGRDLIVQITIIDNDNKTLKKVARKSHAAKSALDTKYLKKIMDKLLAELIEE